MNNQVVALHNRAREACCQNAQEAPTNMVEYVRKSVGEFYLFFLISIVFKNLPSESCILCNGGLQSRESLGRLRTGQRGNPCTLL